MRIFRRVLQMLDVNADDITDGQVLAWNDATEKFIAADASAGGSGAPANATYITQTHHANLSDEQALEDLATGLVKNTTGTGVLSIAAAGTDYYAPGGTDVAVADGGTGASDAPTARTNLGLVPGTDVASQSAFADHSARHENGGADEISVAGLSGTLADPQPTDATKVDSGVATDGQILTADGAGGAGWEDAPAGGTVAAGDVTFTPAGTIAASDVQAAVEEVATDAASALSAHEADTTGVHGITDTSALALTANVPSLATFNDHSARHEDGGADEISIQGLAGTPTELTNHLNDTSDAHDASAISVLDTAGNFTGTDVESVLAELQDNIDAGGGGGGSGSKAYPIQLLNPRASTLAGNSFFTVLALTDWDAGHWEFVKDVDGKIYGQVRVPPAYASGGVIRLAIAANATSGATRLGVGTKAVADGESLNPTLTDETKQDITVPGTAYLRKDVTFTLTETLAANDLLLVEIFHEGSHTNDTLAVNTLLMGAWLEVTA